MRNIFRPAARLLALLVVLGSLGLGGCHGSDDETTVLGDWTTGNSFSGTARNGAVSFVINNVAYVGTGLDANGVRYNDLYAFNPGTGSWTKQTPMPAAAGSRYYAVAFGAGGKGYVGTGYDGSKPLSDFWQFDPAGSTTTTTNGAATTTPGSWKPVADLTSVAGGTARYSAVAGSVGDLGYVGCGYDGNYQKDFYRYNPTTNTWSTFAGFPGDKRRDAVAFTLSGQLYVGTGTNNNLYNTDFWAYDPAKDTWAVRRKLLNQTTGSDTYDFSAVARANAVAFTINNVAYVTVGSNTAVRTDCYAYDPVADTWTLKNPFLGAGRNNAVAFGIGDYGYVGLGSSGSPRFDDFWKFSPDVEQE